MEEDYSPIAKKARYADQDDNGYKLVFDEKKDEALKTEQHVWTQQTQFPAFCEMCFLLNLTQISASYLCYLCSKYLCAGCNERHDNPHSMVEKESTGDERDGQIKRFLDEIRKESESERMEMFNRADVFLVDRFSVTHELDKMNHCLISGLCRLDESRWVICDCRNNCIKVFSIGSHILQRYIRFGSEPHGVTAINVQQEPTEQGVMAATDISVPNQSTPDKQCLIAVTLPEIRRIWFINLTRNPAKKIASIDTKKYCRDIVFSGDKIFTLCSDKYSGRDGPWFIIVLSTGGLELKTIPIRKDMYKPCLAVGPGMFYLTDLRTHKVLCMNDKGIEVSHQKLERLLPWGISVDQDTDKVYISRGYNRTLYRFNSRLESRESLFKFNVVSAEGPHCLFVYRDRVYVSHGQWSTNSHIVSVVRVI